MVDNINCRGLVLSSWHRMHKNAGEPLLSESITFELVISLVVVGNVWMFLQKAKRSPPISPQELAWFVQENKGAIWRVSLICLAWTA